MQDERAIRRAKRALGQPRREGEAAFVIVLTLEAREAGAEPQWRWRVRSVETGDEAHFQRVVDVLAYIAAIARVPAPR